MAACLAWWRKWIARRAAIRSAQAAHPAGRKQSAGNGECPWCSRWALHTYDCPSIIGLYPAPKGGLMCQGICGQRIDDLYVPSEAGDGDEVPICIGCAAWLALGLTEEQ
jgi:hypothetical protein